MSRYAVAIEGIQGEETLLDFPGTVSCSSMQFGIDLPVVATGADRTDGASVHGSIVLQHNVDSASPALRDVCVRGATISDVTITRLKMVGTAMKPAEIVKLKTVKIVEVLLETPVDAATGEPGEEPVEFFALDYDEVKWEYKTYDNGVESATIAGTYDTGSMTTQVSIA